MMKVELHVMELLLKLTNEWEKFSKFEKTMFSVIMLMQDMINYGLENPKSEIGKLIYLGTGDDNQ